MSEHEHKHLITRRRTLALLGSAGGGLLLAGTGAGFGSAFAHTAEGDDHVASAATACTLTAEAQLKIARLGNRLGKGLAATVTLAVNANATPALIGARSPSS